MKATLLLLRLEGVLQSWGIKARWDIRDTASAPTKSGVIGMIGCALGYRRDSVELANLFDRLKMAVRIENPGIITMDYHTVQGNLWTAAGNQRNHTIVSKRYYLQDASFLVILEGEKSLIESISAAIQNPKWPIYLGRKSCVPTRPVFEGLTEEYANLEEALRKIPWKWRGAQREPKTTPKTLQCFLEDERCERTRPDHAPMFPSRLYRLRGEKAFRVNLPNEG